jgi:hypothetical protein
MRVIGRAGSGLFGLTGFICLFGFIGLIGLFALTGSAQGASAQGAPIGAGPGPGPGAGQAQSYAIDQSRYFASPAIESAQRKQRMEAAAAFPSVAPAGGAVIYLRRAEVLLGQLERHNALRISRARAGRLLSFVSATPVVIGRQVVWILLI